VPEVTEKLKRKLDWRIVALWTGLAAFLLFGPKLCLSGYIW